jgi:hypothetical protein
MSTQTAMSAAFVKAGATFTKTRARLYTVAADFVKADEGDRDEWLKLCAEVYDEAIKRMPGRDRVRDVHKDRAPIVARPATTIAGGQDQGPTVQQDQQSCVQPVREPSESFRAIALNAEQRASRSILDSWKTSDGRRWVNVGAHELDGMRRDGRTAALLKEKLGALSNQQQFMTVGELLPEITLTSIRKQAFEAERADA